MPALGKGKTTPQQRASVAVGKAVGRTGKQIAADLGIAESTAKNLPATPGPEAKGVIDRIIADNPDMVAGLMQSIVESLRAEISPTSKLTPEQRFTARSQAVSVLQLGQPPSPPPATSTGPGAVPGGGVFLGDMLAVYRSMVHQAPE